MTQHMQFIFIKRLVIYVLCIICSIWQISFAAKPNKGAATIANEAKTIEPNSIPVVSSEAVYETAEMKTTTKNTFYPSFADIVEPLLPAVVNIYTVHYNKKLDLRKKDSNNERFPFEQFKDLFEQFNIPFQFEEMYSNPRAVSLGSGFIIDATGFIVTNNHVVAEADEVYVKLTDDTELPAKIIGTDPKTDLALLKVEGKDKLPFVKFGDSSKARVGDWVITIGNPFGGLGGTVTTGIISSKGRDIDINTGNIVDDFIQTDAAINKGNSGGPMFNIAGEVIGVNTAIFSPLGTNIGIGFAIPSNTAKNIIEQIKKSGKVSRGRLGVMIQEVTSEIAEGFGLKELIAGALVTDVEPGGAGDKAGIKAGDIIVEFGDQAVKNSRKLQVLVADAPINKDIKIVVIRSGNNHELIARITEADKDITENYNKASITKNDITFNNLTDELRRKFSIKDNLDGVVVTYIAKNHKNYGLHVGDVVVAINQENIENVDQFNMIYENAKKLQKQNIILFVKRQRINIFIALPIIH
jgi:serine protease Do